MFLRPLSLTLLAALVAAPAVAAPLDYVVDPRHSQVEFTYTHLGFSNITGRFNQVAGEIRYDPDNVAASTVRASVQMDSVDTGVDKLDEHLESDDFFDTAKFPTAEFVSTAIEAAAPGKLTMSGDLTLHGVTRPVSFEVTLNKAGEHPMKKVAALGFDAHATVKRSDFGITNYLAAASDEIRIEITVEATAKPAE
jgi:polyisoprenoid-binding protein YceI